MHDLRLISLYYQVCDIYNTNLRYTVQRFSNNGNEGQITDEELITMYLFAHIHEAKYEKRQIYDYFINHWLSWFPEMPSYQTFVNRLNRLTDAFAAFLDYLIIEDMPQEVLPQIRQIILGDSIPIVTCSGNRKGKVASDLCKKSYCASKNMWYYGVKLHLLAQSQAGTLPAPTLVEITPADTHDLTALRPVLENAKNTIFVLDKAYYDEALYEEMLGENCVLFTPEKAKRGESSLYKSIRYAFRKQLQTAVSKVRQPIESLFNWLDEKTKIQTANKVRSREGLRLHIFGKLTAAVGLKTGFFNP